MKYHWVRIRLKWIFTSKVKRFEYTDSKGVEREAWTEQQEEYVCPHKHLEQVNEIIWKCMDCDYAYFTITSKLILSRTDLIQFMENLANHFTAEVVDKKEAKKREGEIEKKLNDVGEVENKGKKKKNAKK